jgi:hypothetical protein
MELSYQLSVISYQLSVISRPNFGRTLNFSLAGVQTLVWQSLAGFQTWSRLVLGP